MTRSARLRLTLALVTLLAACRSDSLVGPARTGQPTVIAEGSQSGIPYYMFPPGLPSFIVVVKTTITGTLEGTVDWTFASHSVAISWHRGDCTQNPYCELISQNANPDLYDKPKTVTALNASAGTYSLAVYNSAGGPERGPTESLSYRVVLTP